MLPIIKYRPVYWVDGMKITKQHFQQEENALLDQLRDARCQFIHQSNFGILPQHDSDTPSLEMQVTAEYVELSYCRGITPGGMRIEITPTFFAQPLQLRLDQIRQDPSKMNRELYIAIAAEPFYKVPSGEPDPEETPLRHPFSLPRYRLASIPVEEINSKEYVPYHLAIAKIRIESDTIRHDPQFIPPCTSMQSLPILKNKGALWNSKLPAMLADTMKIVKKIKANRQNNRLADNLGQLAADLMGFLAQTIDTFRLSWAHEAPIHTFLYFTRMARHFKVSLACLPERENLMNYFSKWTEFSPIELENAIDTLIQQEYNHLHLEEAMTALEAFTEKVYPLFSKLSQLDFIEPINNDFFV